MKFCNEAVSEYEGQPLKTSKLKKSRNGKNEKEATDIGKIESKMELSEIYKGNDNSMIYQ